MLKLIRYSCLSFALSIGLILLMPGFMHAQQEVKTHIVERLDNYYSISLKYDISIEDLKIANPGITSPRPGDTLLIPFRGSSDKDPDAEDCSLFRLRIGKDKLYRIALMIPFYLEQVQDTTWAQKLDASRINEVSSFRFIQFYQGFMMAADSLRKSGLDVEIRVFDVDQQLYKVRKALSDPAMKKADLIVGPFFKNSFETVADFARQNHIPIINPLSSRSDILASNPYVYKTIPSYDSQPESIAQLISRDFPGHNVMIYTANKFQGMDRVSRLKYILENNASLGLQSVPVIDYSTDSISGFLNHAVLFQPNLVVIYAENEALPAALLSKLSALKNDYPMTIIGFPDWETFSNLESIYMVALNAHIFTYSFVDMDAENTRNFIREYRTRYLDEPLNYAYSGFDVGYYFLNALMTYGGSFDKCLEYLQVKLLQSQYDFNRSAEKWGYENTFWKILQYDGYKLVDKSLCH